MASDAAYMRLALRILGEISAIILFPALAAFAAFRRLEGTGGPQGTAYALFAVAFALTSVLLVRRAKDFGREFERLSHGPKDRV